MPQPLCVSPVLRTLHAIAQRSSQGSGEDSRCIIESATVAFQHCSARCLLINLFRLLRTSSTATDAICFDGIGVPYPHRLATERGVRQTPHPFMNDPLQVLSALSRPRNATRSVVPSAHGPLYPRHFRLPPRMHFVDCIARL